MDVKCRTFYRIEGESYFDFNADHIELHLNMMKYTCTPILIALYERIKNTDIPKSDSLRMIDISYMKIIIEKVKLKKE